LFVTIACGAISGFHSLVSSGTTPKMLNKECDARFIGLRSDGGGEPGGVLSLIAACSLFPGDYFGINVPARRLRKLGLHTVNLDLFSSEVGEKLAAADRRSGFAGGGDGADFPGDSGDDAADGLLVSLRDYV